MVLLSRSVSALRKLLGICEGYAVAHGLRYNVQKSEFLVFKPKGGTVGTVPAVYLYGTELKRTSQFKYLGHWVTEDLSDGVDIERERRSMAVRCNMLARRFARCTRQVKITLFKAYCQSFYTCSLWVRHSASTLNTLRVQYNNAFRMLMGLPRYCSASGMLTEARTDGFHAILRKRAASLMRRVCASPNSLLRVVASRLDCPFQYHWVKLHVR
ncbi:uncharacterized protein LOC134656090 [Cydia amplana]|uniref:uncharacterized protein LOC134656090 n=1 Tax=Cydia amplana TaxID=1869771 RepID=UPI002FE5433E